jgi:hypothetical protein
MPKNYKAIDGRGPWVFDVPELTAGESWVLDLRNREFRNQPRYFRRFLPLDSAQVTNLNDTAAVEVEYNGLYQDVVPPNVVEGYSETGITGVRIRNLDASATIAAGDVRVTLEKTPFDADDAARADAERSAVSKVVENLTGLPLGGGP